MPKTLTQYYIDQTEIPSLSKTALEAFACGLKVINWKGEIILPPLPLEPTPREVCSQVYEIYKTLLS